MWCFKLNRLLKTHSAIVFPMPGVLGDSVHGRSSQSWISCCARRVSRALRSSLEGSIVSAGGDLGIAVPMSSENLVTADSCSGHSAHTLMARATDSKNLRICSKGRWSVLFEGGK